MYRFWVQVLTEAGSNAMFGDYNLFVGCTDTAANVTDASNFTTSVPLVTGINDTAAYVLESPSSVLAWCVPQTQEIVGIDGEAWQGTAKMQASTT